MSKKRKSTNAKRPSNKESKKRIRVNLREERMKRDYSLQDISIRTNIPLPFLEALETGIVSQNLRGRKLGKYKQRYLEFLGFPLDAKLRFKMSQPKYEQTRSRKARTISQKIEQPSTLRAMVTGIALAGAMIGILKVASQFLEQEPMLSLDSAKTNPNENKKQIEALASKAKPEIPIKEIPVTSAVGSAVGSLPPLFVPKATAEEIPEEEQFQNALEVEANDRTRVEVLCDGRILASKRLEPSDRVVCRYNKEASVFVRDISRVKIENNDRVIHPMGPLSKGRRLVFRN